MLENHINANVSTKTLTVDNLNLEFIILEMMKKKFCYSSYQDK